MREYNIVQCRFLEYSVSKQLCVYYLALQQERYELLAELRDCIPDMDDFLARLERRFGL